MLLDQRGNRRWFGEKAKEFAAWTAASAGVRVKVGPIALPIIHPQIIEEGSRYPHVLIPGDVAIDIDHASERFIIKQELDENDRLVNVCYKIQNTKEWRRNIGFTGTEQLADIPALKKFPVKELPDPSPVPCWDGKEKNYNPNGGLKFVFLPGMFSDSSDYSAFDDISNALKELGYDEGDMLPMSYNIDPDNPLLGVPYQSNDTLRNPYQTLAFMSRLIYRWKEEHPLDKFWLIGHSQGGWLAHQLALLHSDAIAGVVTLNGALKGGGGSITSPELASALTGFLDNPAGQFFIDMTKDRAYVSSIVESQVDYMVKRGIPYFTFGAFDDLLTTPDDTVVHSASKNIDGEQVIQLIKPRPSSADWESIEDQVQALLYQHQLPLHDPYVMNRLKVIIPHKKNNEVLNPAQVKPVTIYPNHVNPNVTEFTVVDVSLGSGPLSQQNAFFIRFNRTVQLDSFHFELSPPIKELYFYPFYDKANQTSVIFHPDYGVKDNEWKPGTTYTITINAGAVTTRGKILKQKISIPIKAAA